MNSEFKREIYDGRTKEHEMDIEQKTRDPDRIFNLDDFVHLGGRLHEKLNDSLKKWKNFSQNRYLVNFLCEVFSYDCPENFRRKLFEEQETGRRLSGSSKKILTDLTELLVRRIEEIGDDEIRNILEKKYTPEVIRDNFEDLTEDFFLYFLAPVCNRDSDSVRIFLQRVFKRDSLSNYKTDEYLLGMAMDIYRQGIQESTIEILYKLRNCYDSVSPAREPEVISEKNGSQYITNKSRLYLEIQSGVFRPEDYPQIPETLSWYKAAVKPPARNKEKVYKALFDGIFRLYEKEMDDYLRIEAEEKEKRAKLRHRQEGSVPITLWYRSREPIWISGRTRFSGKNCVYELLKGENLMPMEYVEVCLHVIPHQDNSELQKPKRSAVPEGAVFEILCGNAERDGKPLIRSVRAVSIKKVNTEKAVNISEESGLNSRLWTKPKWRLEDCRNSPANGFVVIEILAEEEIPGNLCFAYEFEGKKFKYVPVREETGCSYLPRKTVTAYLDMNLAPFKNARRERDNYVLEGADSITQMEPKQESLRSAI